MYNSDPSHQHHPPWYQWSLVIEQQLQQQHALISQLQHEIELLKLQLKLQEQSKVFHVDKIEYHFDQLKVDTLEGSLQIGLSTANPNQLPMMIEDLALQQKADPKIANQPLSKPTSKLSRLNHLDSIFQHTMSQLGLSVPAKLIPYIKRQSSLHRISLTEDHIELMIDDLEQQLPARIHHYYEQYSNEQNARDPELIKHILQQTMADLEQAVDLYIQQLVEQGKSQ